MVKYLEFEQSVIATYRGERTVQSRGNDSKTDESLYDKVNRKHRL